MKLGGIELVCPRCRGALDDATDTLTCSACLATFPIVAGIPDLRVSPDPWIGLEEDRAKALRVLQESAGRDFAGHVRGYWSLTPTTRTDHAERFTRHVLAAKTRSSDWIRSLERARKTSGAEDIWLDLGCGTADLAAAAGNRTVIGVDVAMRWLVVAKKRLEEEGIATHLVCANAEALPFPERSFDAVMSLGMLEHCGDLPAVLHGACRVLMPGGRFSARTVNRLSLLPEPHVRLWGVGFLPRSWANGYVHWRSGMQYRHHHPWSRRSLQREMERAGFEHVAVEAAASLPSEVAEASPLLQRLTPWYERSRRKPVLRTLAGLFAPLLEVVASTPEG